eukprot:CAMPEP_0174269214 /NCGR_PEP_ID=MMETSP0439-20130205/40265_1 /TAXON_ID=0 /ORGANISM="Stereomyxa ramosa, Strain Chinc5" /LENGTH=216 /DNA_ID=CAMNT_0015357865 /DNA_START=29 /DNA_END=679 /DNA_ORIENTATION=+
MDESRILDTDAQKPNGQIFKRLEIPGKFAFTIENVFTEEECGELIKKAEEGGFEPATLSVEPGVQVYRPETRNNYRYMVDDFENSALLFERIKEHLPEEWGASTSKIRKRLHSVNERLRILRYDEGQKFNRHHDGWFTREGQRSYLTVQLYLNQGFVGGETTFFLGSNESVAVPVVPKTGMVLVFQHDILHEGSLLQKGRKYVIRSDVMYSQELDF